MRADALSSFCQRNPACRRLQNREQYRRSAAAREAVDPQPLCQCCGLPMRRRPRVPICSRTACCRAARKQWYYEHDAAYRARRLAYHARWYAAHRERVARWRAAYYRSAVLLYHANGLTSAGRPFKRPPRPARSTT